MTSILNHDISVVITFFTLISDMISTIFHLIFKAFIYLYIWGREMHNTAYSSCMEDAVSNKIISICYLFNSINSIKTISKRYKSTIFYRNAQKQAQKNLSRPP